MKERHDLPRWARLCAEYRRIRERPDNDVKEVKIDERKYDNCRRKHRDL